MTALGIYFMTQTPEKSNNKGKQQTFEEWMKMDHVLIHLDSRRPGVDLPQHLQNNPAVVLKLSYLFQGTTEHDEKTITAYLKFHGNYHRCVVPWEAVWGMVNSSNENVVWPEDLPPELRGPLAGQIDEEIDTDLLPGKDENETLPPTGIPSIQSSQPLAALHRKPEGSRGSKKKGTHLKRVK